MVQENKASITFICSVQVTPVKTVTPRLIPRPYSLKDEDGAKEALSPAGSDDASDAQVFGEMM
jgi:hypothetical protein